MSGRHTNSAVEPTATCWYAGMTIGDAVRENQKHNEERRFSNHNKYFQTVIFFLCRLAKIHLFAGRAVKRERRKGSSRRQQPAYGAAVNEVARELLRSARSPKRENGGRRYIKHDGMIASPVGSCLCCWQLPLSPPVPPLYCSAAHCPSLSPTRFDAFKNVIVWIVHNMLPILSEQPRHLGFRPVYVGFPYDL